MVRADSAHQKETLLGCLEQLTGLVQTRGNSFAAKILAESVSRLRENTITLVVYAVMVETGLNETELGKVILAACFITDLGTVLALGIFFAHFDVWLAVFVGASLLLLAIVPKLTPWFTARYGNRVSQMEVKYFLFLLFFLGGLALQANSEAVLPAYLLGLSVASLPDYAGTAGEVQEIKRDAEAFYHKSLESIRPLTDSRNAPVQSRLLFGHVGQSLIRYARENDIDLIVVGGRGMSPLKQLVVGSVSQHVFGHAHCPVLVIKGHQSKK